MTMAAQSPYVSMRSDLTGKVTSKDGAWVVITALLGERYQDEDGVSHTVYPTDVEVSYTYYEYEYRQATQAEIDADIAAAVTAEEAEKTALALWQSQKDAERSQAQQERYDRRMQFIAFLTGKLGHDEVLESGYDLPAILYSSLDSPVKQLIAPSGSNPHVLPEFYTSPRRYKIIPRWYGNGLGYEAPAGWLQEIFEWAIVHETSARYSEANILAWLKAYGPTVWKTGVEPTFEEYQGYEPSGCAGSEFYEWAAVCHYGHPYPGDAR